MRARQPIRGHRTQFRLAVYGVCCRKRVYEINELASHLKLCLYRVALLQSTRNV